MVPVSPSNIWVPGPGIGENSPVIKIWWSWYIINSGVWFRINVSLYGPLTFGAIPESITINLIWNLFDNLRSKLVYHLYVIWSIHNTRLRNNLLVLVNHIIDSFGDTSLQMCEAVENVSDAAGMQVIEIMWEMLVTVNVRIPKFIFIS
jgi:hypothetical protein